MPRFADLFAAIRFREAALMVGFPLAGALFAMRGAEPRALVGAAAFACGMTFLFLSIYTFNAFCGFPHDAANPRLRALGAVPRSAFLRLTAAFLLLALLVLGSLQFWLAPAGLVSFAAWALYSLPQTGWKASAWLGSVVHFATQILHFAMGWAVVAELDGSTFWIAAYFALLFTAGHLHHQVIDYAADRAAGVRTLAVRMGRRRAFSSSLVLFGAAFLYWTLLFVLARIDLRAFVPFALAFAAHAATVWLMAGHGSLRSVSGAARLRDLYRAYFLAAGAVFAGLKLFGSA